MNELLEKEKGLALLEKVKRTEKEGCVTLTMNTHYTQPLRGKDPITLKNLMREAETRLYEAMPKREVWPILDNLKEAAEEIDFANNSESLVIFANDDFHDWTILPVEVSERVVIDRRFATRDIIRAIQEQFNYYILILDRNQVRLIEAFNDRLVRELSGEFPLENPLFPANRLIDSMEKGQGNLIREFFNQVDKALWDAIGEQLHPIILATEDRNFDYYMEVTDHADLIAGYVNVNGDDQPAYQIIRNSWAEASELLRMGNIARLTEIEAATGEHRFESDLSQMWTAISEGRGATLFVKKGFHQPGRVLENPDDGTFTVIPTPQDEIGERDVADDLIDEMVEMVMNAAGEVVFIDSDDLEKWGNVALITRY